MSSRDLAQSSCRQDLHDTAFPHKVKPQNANFRKKSANFPNFPKKSPSLDP